MTTITTAAHTRIGAAPESGYESYFNGTIDEVRTSKIARSADWIKTEYNNQNSPSTFYTVSSATSLTVPSQVSWLITDQLGTPRMIIDQTGSLANVKRHDYLPFGEELFAPVGGRTATLGYGTGDGIRQQFTAKERDTETGLDYFGARHYSGLQGRFVSRDPLNPLASRLKDEKSERSFRLYISQPANWNGYSYVRNNPLRHVDSDGRSPQDLIPAPDQALLDALAGFTTTLTVTQQIAISMTRTVLNIVFGPPTEVVPGGLAQHEVAFAGQVTQFTGSSFVGVANRNHPGIDGILTQPGVLHDVRGVASLTETARNNPRVLIDLAEDKEKSAQKGGYKHVDLFIKATGLDSQTVVEYINSGSGITNVASGGTIRSINIFTSDNRVVRVEGTKVSVCDEHGKCH
jgi:RHS repeat-associated protein